MYAAVASNAAANPKATRAEFWAAMAMLQGTARSVYGSLPEARPEEEQQHTVTPATAHVQSHCWRSECCSPASGDSRQATGSTRVPCASPEAMKAVPGAELREGDLVEAMERDLALPLVQSCRLQLGLGGGLPGIQE